ncbi:MAG: hypothetical protein DRG78_00920 [Epsilonproteobacteria bacterium]|nr:MAG: hypothetical protein DRG78_00920 [Campylobacterota bacterium]
MNENKYSNLSLKQLLTLTYDTRNKDNLDLANALYDVYKLFRTSDMNRFLSRYEPERSPHNNFSKSIQNKLMLSNSINMNLIREYLTFKCLELLENNYNLLLKKSDDNYYDEDNITNLHIDKFHHSRYLNYIELIKKNFFNIIISQEYNNLIKEKFPVFINEFNKQNNTDEALNYYETNILLTYINLNNPQQVVEYLYEYPISYDYIKICKAINIKEIVSSFLLSFQCNYILKYNIKGINTAIEKMISENYSDDEYLFYQLIQTKSKSHMAMYFSKELKSKLRKDFNLSLLCYKNTCQYYKKDVKRMLGRTVTSTTQFKYLYG